MEYNISDLFITSDKHIFDALSIINQKEIQIALVVDDSKKLIGSDSLSLSTNKNL